jgi:hypothetical protein
MPASTNDNPGDDRWRKFPLCSESRRAIVRRVSRQLAGFAARSYRAPR